MHSVIAPRVVMQMRRARWIGAPVCGWLLAWGFVAQAAPAPKSPMEVKNATAKSQAEMKPYTDVIANADVTFDLVPIPGGKFMMGSPDSEAGRKDDEGPQHEVEIEPFWMGKCEVTWNEYEIWMFNLDIQRRELNKVVPTETEKQADAVTRPTKPYTDMTFGMGKEGFPAICMTQLAAKILLQMAQRQDRPLLPAADRGRVGICLPGRHENGLLFRRRPGQAGRVCLVLRQQRGQIPQGRHQEAQSLGLARHARQCGRMDARSVYSRILQAVRRQSNQRSLGHSHEALSTSSPRRLVGRRSGGLRSAARLGSHKDWKQQDPQLPQSIWYFTDALFLGFRVVRPLHEPTEAEKSKIWDAGANE